MFSVDTYNFLPSISEADKLLRQQLHASGATLDQHLAELVQLFSETGFAERYTVWLCHAHFLLKAEERMVAKGDTTEPTLDTSADIIVERWGPNGEELEHKHVACMDAHPEPLPEGLLAGFNAINNRRKITALGLCRAPSAEEIEMIRKGYSFLERTDSMGRKHVVSVVQRESAPVPTFITSWTLVPDSSGLKRALMECSHLCESGTPPHVQKPDSPDEYNEAALST